MSFTFWISRRLRLNGDKHGANATGVVIAVTGVALAIIIMLLTVSIVIGFKQQVTARVLGFDGQLWVLPDYNYAQASSATTLSLDSQLDSIIQATIPGATTSMQFNQPGILKTDTDFAGVYFCGFDRAHDLTFERGNMVKGEYPDFTVAENSNKVVISNPTAKSLGLDVGDKINACFFITDAIKSRKFEIAGIYESGFGDYDRIIVYGAMPTLQRIAAADSLSGTKLSIILPKGYNEHIQQTAEALQTALLDRYQNGNMDKLYPVDNVEHTGAIYFNWLSLLDTNVVVIFILMICVSGFTLISSMFIIILERIPTIGILRSLGSTRKQIRSIFVNMTMKIVGIGMLIGNAVGIGLIYVQHQYNLLKLDPNMYYLRYVPVDINWMNILYLNIGVVVVSWLILILPSRVASGISPAVTMRFE